MSSGQSQNAVDAAVRGACVRAPAVSISSRHRAGWHSPSVVGPANHGNVGLARVRTRDFTGSNAPVDFLTATVLSGRRGVADVERTTAGRRTAKHFDGEAFDGEP